MLKSNGKYYKQYYKTLSEKSTSQEPEQRLTEFVADKKK